MVQSNSDFNVFLSKDKYLSVYLICINLVSNLDNETILSTEIYNLQKKMWAVFNAYNYRSFIRFIHIVKLLDCIQNKQQIRKLGFYHLIRVHKITRFVPS